MLTASVYIYTDAKEKHNTTQSHSDYRTDIFRNRTKKIRHVKRRQQIKV